MLRSVYALSLLRKSREQAQNRSVPCSVPVASVWLCADLHCAKKNDNQVRELDEYVRKNLSS